MTAKRCKLPTTFEPRFWAGVDGRLAICKEIRRRYHDLKADTGCDSYQKDLLVQRAIFVALQLESAEVNAMEGKEFDLGRYTQAVNSLLGLLRALGLERKMKEVVNLREYVNARGNGTK